MASRSLIRSSTRPNPNVCARCAFRASKSLAPTSKRWIGTKYLAKVANAELEWEEKAKKIRAGEEKSMLSILEERGLVQKVTGDRKTLDKYMTDRRLGAYVGIDPTAASLHVGHLLPLMSLFWMHLNGYHTLSLLGGATAKIGDPTDRLTTRVKDPASIRTANMARMHYQLKRLWMNVIVQGKKYGYEPDWAWRRELINNNAWWNKMPMLEVLQVLGPGMRMGTMLARETVKNKMTKGDGMSYAEFTYPIMQAWDWWYMFHTKGIHMQIGGSDQYGNIVAGIDAIKYISTHHSDPVVRKEAQNVGEPMGFTVPLLTTSSGQKFGKSAGNAVWLDPDETSSIELYSFFLRTSDADVGRYLKLFTFMPLIEIDALLEKHQADPSRRLAQHKLAQEFVELVHGRDGAVEAMNQHRLLFQKSSSAEGLVEIGPDTNEGSKNMSSEERPKVNIQLPQSLIYRKDIGSILYATGLAETRSEGFRLVQSAGAYIGGPGTQKKQPMIDGHVSWTTISNWLPEETRKFLIHGDLLLFRRAKHHIKTVQVISDEEYVSSGQKYPGMQNSWKRDVLSALAVKNSITLAERENIEKMLKEAEEAAEMESKLEPTEATPSKKKKREAEVAERKRSRSDEP
ncbi:uncharacterized protein L3040_005355 [Drepanopeziza brunnea f. sp. 'multigermtubi']|uniref:Tyrosine--tRNA ligase n=1 Tax=Marssonina brunnea f. sp. multigermtubi (strain MB_m1) TaxID=1072389 RepID=K1WHV6_MARBU|nr:uncharacterized protein MBM_04712 [Drepanopeziza brunnea f. sp. 'multigermtubi' MB_m1]EKD17135.1 hypothetical protein MBM_04712 [Drepanopeziza brunnea f. sp. 'multigermtubi' MB_m1]KAJ5041787.1 hypothetical protein L3040_005355 [Drepanopeziza brunnea f. sp. 'multigermtubi']